MVVGLLLLVAGTSRGGSGGSCKQSTVPVPYIAGDAPAPLVFAGVVCPLSFCVACSNVVVVDSERVDMTAIPASRPSSRCHKPPDARPPTSPLGPSPLPGQENFHGLVSPGWAPPTSSSASMGEREGTPRWTAAGGR